MRAAPLSIRPRRAPSTEAMFFSGPTTSTVLVLIMIIIIIIIVMIGEMSASDARLAGGLESFFGWRPTLNGPGKMLVTRPKTLLMIPVINHLLCFELFGVKSKIHLSIQQSLRQVSVAANRNHDERVSMLGPPPPPQPCRLGGKLCHIRSETSRTGTNWNLEASLQISCSSAERGNPEVAAGQEASEREGACPVGPCGSEWRAKGSAAPLQLCVAFAGITANLRRVQLSNVV